MIKCNLGSKDCFQALGCLSLVSAFNFQELTFGRRLHSDLFAEVPSTCGGDGCRPDQVLLPVVEVCDPVEQQLWISFILTGQLNEAIRERKKMILKELQEQRVLYRDERSPNIFSLIISSPLKIFDDKTICIISYVLESMK